MKTTAGIEKPLAKWTLGEVKEFCCSRSENKFCKDCNLYILCMSDDVSGWDLSEKPKFTDQEIQDAKNIVRIMGAKDITISRNRVGEMFVVCSHEYNGSAFLISKELFPSIQIGEKFHVSEIIGDADA